MTFFKPHKEILPPAQQALWPTLTSARDFGFVLYGGTAVALQIGHRESVDFDFFTEKTFSNKEIFEKMPCFSQTTLTQDAENTLSLEVSGCDGDMPVKISFFGGIDFGRVGTPQLTDDSVVLVASLLDLLATKLSVVTERVQVKDYQDIAGILRAGISLEDGLASAGLLYGKNFSPSEVLRTICYFEGGNLSLLTQAEKNTILEAAANVRKLPTLELASKSLGLN